MHLCICRSSHKYNSNNNEIIQRRCGVAVEAEAEVEVDMEKQNKIMNKRQQQDSIQDIVKANMQTGELT